MTITNLIWFLVPVLVLQIFMFFIIRRKKKQMKKNDILGKFGISSRSELFRMLQDPELSEEDRAKLQKIYEQGLQS